MSKLKLTGGLLIVGAIVGQIWVGQYTLGPEWDPWFTIAGWQLGALFGLWVFAGYELFLSKPAGHDSPDVACPKCGEAWNLDTGRGIRLFDDDRVQCTNCNHTEYGFLK